MGGPRAAPVGPGQVRAAARVLDGVVRRTPALGDTPLDAVTGARLALKAESLQHTGSFKLRGAYHALHRLGARERARGVVAASSGNFAAALARAAWLLGTTATVVMPRDAPPEKLAAARAHGAEVVPYDRYDEDRDAVAGGIAAERRAPVLSPFDDPDVIAGQGTAALELAEQAPQLDLLVVPVGGGGLAAGCAAALPGPRVVGVEPDDRPAAREALRADRPVPVAVPRTVLDGQQTTRLGEHPLRVLRERAVRVVGVTDAAALDAVRVAADRLHLVLEPSGASALAAVLDGTVEVAGRRVGVVLSGGNVEPGRLRAWL